LSVTNTNRWKLGLFVTLGCGLLVGILMWLGISQLQQRTTPAYFYFDETVNGLEIGSPVKFRGVSIGSVDEIMPAPDRRNIEVLAGLFVERLENFGIAPEELERGAPAHRFVSDDLRAQLVTSALTSVSFIQIDVFDPPPPRRTYTFPTPWETIPTTQSTFKSLEEGLRGVLSGTDGQPGLTDLPGEILSRFDRVILDLDLASSMSQLQATLKEARDLMAALRTAPLVDAHSQTSAALELAIVDIGRLAAGLAGEPGSPGQAERIAASFESMGASVEDADFTGAMDSLRGAGEGFRGSGVELTALVREMRASLVHLQATLVSLENLTNLLARDPGSILHGRSPQPLPFRR